jgi:hypothetical protein
MNKTEYMAYHADCCERMKTITAAKNADYTGEGNDPFANFTRVETLGITDTVRGFLVRMTDKLSRITSFAQKGVLQVKDESIEDTLLDLANYCILLAGFIKSRKNNSFSGGFTITNTPVQFSSNITLTPNTVVWPHDPNSTSSKAADGRAP